MRRFVHLAVIGAVAVSTVLASTVVAGADGVAAFPNRIAIADGLRGGTYERTLTLQNDFDEPGVFELEAQGPIADWIDITSRTGDELTVTDAPPGERVSLQITVDVPSDTPNGSYEGGVGALLVVGEDDTGEGTGSGVRLGVVVPISIEITGEQVIAGSFLELIVDDGEVGLLHRVTAVVQNSGNVGLSPEIVFQVLDDGELIDTLEPSLDLVAPGETARLSFGWETDTQRPGDYTARASAVLGDFDLGTRERAFSLAPRGTLTRSGALRLLELVGDPPRPGGVARIQAEFSNTGQIESRAELVGELFRDGVLIGAPRNPPTLVQPGDIEVLELLIDTDVAGSYTLIAKVNFEGEETEALTLEFFVAEPEPVTAPSDAEGGSGAVLAIGIGAGGVALLAGAALVWWRRRSGRTGETPATVEHHATTDEPVAKATSPPDS